MHTLYFILTVCVFAIFVCLCIYFSAPNPDKLNKKELSWVDKSDLIKNAKNGDIIFLSGDNYGEKSIKWWLRTPFSHVGFLFREDHPETGEDILYIWDADLGQGAKDGPRVQKLEDKLNKFKGFKIGAWKKFRGERPKTEDILKIVKEYHDYEMDRCMYSYWWADKPHTLLYKLFRSKKNEIYCSELIAATFQKLGVMKNNHLPGWYSPHHFYERKCDFVQGYSLSDTIYFKF